MSVEDFEIENIVPRISYTATAGQTTFAIPFPFTKADDIEVFLNNSTTPTPDADYTITGAEETEGGQLVFDTGLTLNTRVTIARNTSVERTANFTTSGSWTADAVNREFQRLTLVQQEIKDTLSNRIPTLPATTALTNVPIQDQGTTLNAGKVLMWGTGGNAIINGPSAADIEAAATIVADVQDQIDEAQDILDDINTATASVTYLWAGTAGGTANGLALTPSPALGSYTAGVKYRFLVDTTNTSGAVTLNVSALGAKDIKKTIGGALVALSVGDLPASTIAEVMYDGTQFQLMNVRTFGQGADVASASTVNLDTATGNYVNITGTTTITAITLAQGRRCLVKFAGALTLTNGASLINLSGANITTAAGDTAEFVGEASGVVRMTAYSRASGAALSLGSSGLVGAGYAVGRYYFPDITGNSAGTAPADIDTIYATPFTVLTPVTFNRAGVRVTTAVSGQTMRLGLYNVADGVPTTLVEDFGTVDCSSTGEKEITVDLALDAGVYAIVGGYGSNAGIAVRVYSVTPGAMRSMGTGDTNAVAYPSCWSGNQAYGALPANFPSPLVYYTDGGPIYNGVWLRKV